MIDKEFAEFNGDDLFLDYLVEMLKAAPRPSIQMVRPQRLYQVISAKRLLEHAFDGEIKVEFDFHMLGSSGALRVESESLEVHSPDAFAMAAQMADNFEVYPLANGKIRFAMLFYRVLIPVA